MQTLKGRTCVFAGATAGDGTASVKALCAGGMNVVMATHNIKGAEALISAVKLAGLPGKCSALSAEGKIPPEQQSETYRKVAEEFGSVDVIICNTGDNGRICSIDDLSGEDLLKDVDHLVGTSYKMLRAALPALRQSKAPRVIFMSSVEGCRGGKLEGLANAIGKGAVRALTLNAAARLAPEGITVNCVSKGAITRMEPQKEGAPDPEAMLPFIPLARLGTPEDLAESICFLASEESAYITGQILELNGGMNLGR